MMVWLPLLSADSMKTSQSCTAKHPSGTPLTLNSKLGGRGRLGEVATQCHTVPQRRPKMAKVPCGQERTLSSEGIFIQISALRPCALFIFMPLQVLERTFIWPHNKYSLKCHLRTDFIHLPKHFLMGLYMQNGSMQNCI